MESEAILEKEEQEEQEYFWDVDKYFIELEEDVKNEYDIANRARAKGIDPVSKVEIPLATSMAEKCVGLISTIYEQLPIAKITERMLELEHKYGQLDTTVSFIIAQEIAEEKYCKFDNKHDAIDAGIRVGFAYITLGVVASPIEGYTGFEIKKTKDGNEYWCASFSGPIRSAGTTATCVVLMLIDYLREYFGYSKYDPSEEEVRRYVTENTDYHERVTNLQYFPTEEEMVFLAKNLPIEIGGDPTESKEVSNYKDLPRVPTNFIRGGMCLTFSEGLAQKAVKGVKRLSSPKKAGLKCTGFDFLGEYLEIHEKRTSGKGDTIATYIKDLVAGRPVYGHPSKSGGFRFRYGRSRVSGFSSASVHPAVMGVTNGFISHGTQLKIEKPTKGCILTSCDSIEGPIVKLKNGSVRQINEFKGSLNLYKDIEEIIYLGDILFPLGDVMDRNHDLLKAGYVEEWWDIELRNKLDVTGEKLDYDVFNVDFSQAIDISKKYSLALYPKFIYYWSEITSEDFWWMMDYLQNATWMGSNPGKMLLPWESSVREKFSTAKRALELIGISHEVVFDNVVIDEINAKALLVNLGLPFMVEGSKIRDKVLEIISKKDELGTDVLSIVNSLSKFVIRDKSGDFIGTRMGRPEKAKLRKLTGSPNVLFPISDQGGRFRSVNESVNVGFVKYDWPNRVCPCGNETIYRLCENCGEKTKKQYFCRECNKTSEEKCLEHEKVTSTQNRKIDMPHYFKDAIKILGYESYEIPPLIKGVRGMSNDEHDFEHLSKGILRAKYNLCVNKDGTIRYDGTEISLTHFKPKEIGTSIAKLRELGYLKDIKGEDLTNGEQICELRPHDVVLPACSATNDERADDVFMNIANFLDDELQNLYGLSPYYNIHTREDLVGHLIACMAPHNCAGVIGRIIGFCELQGIVASPYMHAAMRRDCFSYDSYLPIKSKGSWRIRKIGELVEELGSKINVDIFGTEEIKVSGYESIGFNDGVRSVNVNNFTKHAKGLMVGIKTALGKYLEVSDNHKFLIDGKLKLARHLKIGDKVPLPKKIKIQDIEIDEINLLEYLDDDSLMVRGVWDFLNKMVSSEEIKNICEKLSISSKLFYNYKKRDSFPLSFIRAFNQKIYDKIIRIGKLSFKGDNVSIPIVIHLSDELLEVIGLYVAEGYSRSVGGKKGLNQVYISSFDSNLRKLIERVIYSSFGLRKSENKTDRVTFSSKILYLFFTKILEAGESAYKKRVPYLFLNLKRKRLACFLRGYFEGDGSVEKNRKKICCDTVSEELINDLEFCLMRFGIFTKRYEYEKEPGPKLKSFYQKNGRMIPLFKITKLIIGSDFVSRFSEIGFLSDRKSNILKNYINMGSYGMRIIQDDNFVYDPIVSIEELPDSESYCLNVDTDNHLVMCNSIISRQCDGDESAVMMLLDVLINFSRKFLPSHRGGTQDAPLVLNAKIQAGEVDDQILDFEMCSEYPLNTYEKGLLREHSSVVKMERVKDRLRDGVCPFRNTGFTHDSTDFNVGVLNGAYKVLPTMKDKVASQMELVGKIRAVDTDDVARLVIERHFIRDIRGNLRKFSRQQFRCVSCNEKFRRPPLIGVCTKCGGKIIFTISEGSIKKYLEPALELANNYNISEYTKEGMELTKEYIESIFGKDNEKQADLKNFF